MYPDNNQQLPADYLNQISPQAPKKMRFSRKQMFIFGGIGAIIILMVITLLLSALANGTKSTEKLAARLLTTQEIVTDASSKIKNTQLRALNSNVKIYLTNTIRDIKAPLSKEKVNLEKLNKSVLADESSDATLATLEDARLNATYDRTYAREMAYRLNTLLILMRQIHDNTGNSELKSFLGDAIENLAPSQEAFANFNATNG